MNLSEVATLRLDGTASLAILDVEGSLARFGGDQQLFVEMTTFMLEDAPLLLAKLRTALSAGNAEAVERSAHALKGLLMNGGGIRAGNAAQTLEDAARSRDLGQAHRLLQTIDAEIEALSKAIRESLNCRRESVS
jgi:HPt (histidine-containing phosphotransfer) domain-containing protein